MSGRNGSSDDLTAPFIFVPTGDPEPTEWMAAHPNWIKIPATLVPRGSTSSGATARAGLKSTAVAGAIAGAAPGVTEGVGVGVIGGAGELLTAAALAPFAAFFGAMFYSSGTASPDVDEMHPRGEGFDLHPAMPPLPGLVPPVAGDPRSEEGGFTSMSPAPPRPGFDQAPPMPSVLPGRPAEEQRPTILQQDRNEGLSGGARTHSQRARGAARAADPAVTQVLPGADWRAHHLINVAGLQVAPDLIAAAAQAGWRTDDPGNVAALPASPQARQKLRAAGIDRPVHNSGHRNWNAEVRERLTTIRQELSDQGAGRGTEAYGQQARKALEKLQNDLRQEMTRKDRLTQNILEMSSQSA